MLIQNKIITLIVLIILSGFFSGTETAFFSLSMLRIKHLLKKKVRGAKTLEKLKGKPQRLLITILIGNNVVNIGASALATSLAFDFSMSYAVGIATGVMTLLILIFGEITPKSLATRYNEQIALFVGKIILTIEFVLFPIIILFEGLTNLLMPNPKEKPLVTEDEIKTFVAVGHEAGQIEEDERQMIHRIFKFNDLEARDIMTPRNKMHCISINSKIKNVAKVFYRKGHSRLPVHEGNLDNIKWFVHIMDVQKALLRKGNKTIKKIIRPILFVPATKKLDSLLRYFQRNKRHISIVVDEFGTNLGLVTIEDVLEEIVGEIIDETEKIEPMVRKVSKKSFVVQGRADIDEINTKCGLKLPEKDAPYTIASYILHHLGRIPQQDEELKFPGCEIKIREMDRNTINSVLVRKKRK